MNNKIFLPALFLTATLAGCNGNRQDFDATGNFEAVEILISSEANGTLRQFNVEEGTELNSGDLIGYIDSTQLYLKKKQLIAQIEAVRERKPDIPVQLAALVEQLKTAETEQKRIQRLVQWNAAPTKQLDDVNAQIEVLQKQIRAQKSTLQNTSIGMDKDVGTLYVQVEQLEDQLKKCRLVNPVKGTVLTKYSEENELTAAGKPLYKIANLGVIQLRAYISGNQLALIKLNQQVKVKTDDGNGGMKEYPGQITWISNKAEFTPKSIQTKEERADMVYAIKVNVKNDGLLKPGMYGELKF